MNQFSPRSEGARDTFRTLAVLAALLAIGGAANVLALIYFTVIE